MVKGELGKQAEPKIKELKTFGEKFAGREPLIYLKGLAYNVKYNAI